MYKVEVQADATKTWASSGIRFNTEEQAITYGQDLFHRCTAVREWRVTEVEEGA